MTKMKKINELFTIQETAKKIGVSASTIRNWERRGLIQVKRNPMNRYRLFSDEDVKQILKYVNGNE